MTKFFLYARKSTDEPDRQILSIEAQIAELKEFAQKEQLNIAQTFIESQTAKEPGRPIFNDMILQIEQGKAEGILAWHPDRLARNSVDGGRIIFLLDTGKIQSLKFPLFGLNQRRRESLCSALLSANLNTTLIIFRKM